MNRRSVIIVLAGHSAGRTLNKFEKPLGGMCMVHYVVVATCI